MSVRPRPQPPCSPAPPAVSTAVCSSPLQPWPLFTALRAAVGGSLCAAAANSRTLLLSLNPRARARLPVYSGGRARLPSSLALITISLTSSNPRNTILITLLIFLMSFFPGCIDIFFFSHKSKKWYSFVIYFSN